MFNTTYLSGLTGQSCPVIRGENKTVPKQFKGARSPKRAFMKIYLSANMDCDLHINNILLSLWKSTDSKNKINLSAENKKRISKICKVSIGTIDRYINRLIHQDVMQRIGTGTYYLNPLRFSKGFGVDDMADEYMEVRKIAEIDRSINEKKYKLNINRDKKELPGNVHKLGDANG